MKSSDNGIVKEPKFTFNSLEHLNSHELKILSLVSTQRAIDVMHYVYNYLRPYTLTDINAIRANNFDLDQQKRALVLAAVFNTSHLKNILLAHPEILNMVLEKRKVMARDPVTHYSFAATWHFKLSHLLAAEGNKEGLEIVKSLLPDNNRQHIDNFFSEPVYWETMYGNGKCGPTPGAIAIFYNQQDFFYDIANYITLIPSTEFDEPYKKINICNIVLFVSASSGNHDYFYEFLNSQASFFKESTSMIEACMNFCISQAISGNKAFLNILLNFKFSANSIILLDSGLRHAIDSHDVEIVKLISKKMNLFNYFFIAGYNIFNNDSPLFYAMTNAMKDQRYLKIVKLFLSFGCSIEKNENELIKNDKSVLTIFSKESREKKLVRDYCNASIHFQEFIFTGCYDAHSENYIYSRLDPVRLLVKAANLDKMFFNELLESCLEDETDYILNRHARTEHFKRENFFTSLQDLIMENEGLNFLTARILEKLGDSVMKLWHGEAASRNDKFVTMARFFYESVIRMKGMKSECYQNAVAKLRGMDNMHEVESVPYINEEKRSRSRM